MVNKIFSIVNTLEIVRHWIIKIIATIKIPQIKSKRGQVKRKLVLRKIHHIQANRESYNSKNMRLSWILAVTKKALKTKISKSIWSLTLNLLFHKSSPIWEDWKVNHKFQRRKTLKLTQLPIFTETNLVPSQMCFLMIQNHQERVLKVEIVMRKSIRPNMDNQKVQKLNQTQRTSQDQIQIKEDIMAVRSQANKMIKTPILHLTSLCNKFKLIWRMQMRTQIKNSRFLMDILCIWQPKRLVQNSCRITWRRQNRLW